LVANIAGSRVVIIMPVYNEARHLPRVLKSIGAQTFDRDRLFLIAVDGESDDESAELIRSFINRSKISGRVISNPRRRIPISLNLALQLVRNDDIVVRLDAHTIYGETYITDAVSWLERLPSDVACIGCAQLPVPGHTFSERLVESLYTNPLGLGGADFRLGNDVREVDSVYLGVWRPGVLAKSGGFNEAMEANEDGEITARIRALGYRVLRVPLHCRFLVNRGPWASIRQWNRYGFWRSRMLQRYPGCVRIRHVAAPAVALAAIGTACSPFQAALLPAFVLYALALYQRRAKPQPLLVTIASALFFPVLHFAFAAGMLTGLLAGRISKWPPPALPPAAPTEWDFSIKPESFDAQRKTILSWFVGPKKDYHR
jgi:succinoglycan biosynthesis protein ExoA